MSRFDSLSKVPFPLFFVMQKKVSYNVHISEEKYGPHKKVYRSAWREGGWERKHEFDREIESVSILIMTWLWHISPTIQFQVG